MRNRIFLHVIISCFVIAMFLPNQVFGADFTVKIGHKLPLTGHWEYYGRDSKRGMDLALDYINSQGGIKSMGGAKLVNIYSDSQSRPEIAVSEAERLIDSEKVHMLTGDIFSALSVPTARKAEERKIVYYVPVAAADVITQSGYKYVFRQSTPGSIWGSGMVPFVKYLRDQRGITIKKVAVMNNATEWGKSVAKGIIPALEKAGFEVVSHVEYNHKAADFTTDLRKAHANKPDLVIRVAFLRDAVELSRQHLMRRVKAPHIGISSGDTMREMIEKLGDNAEGKLAEDTFNWDLKPAKWANDMFKKAWGTDMYNEIAAHFQGMLVIKAALEIAGNKIDFPNASLAKQREAIREAFTEVKLKPGKQIIFPWEEISFAPGGQNTFGGQNPFVIHQVTKGTFVTVWPDKFAAKSLDLKAAGF
jgi:branched-chain amino acid transport system substrate-binding protein